MTALGPLELFLIIAIAAVLFGAPVLTFLLGYGLGQRKAAAEKKVSSAGENESTGEDAAND